MTTNSSDCLFFKVWNNVYLRTTIFNKIKESKSVGDFPKRYSYYQINNFKKLLYNKTLLADKVKRNEILDFNDFNEKNQKNQSVLYNGWNGNGKDLHSLLFKSFNQEEDIEFYINLFKNYGTLYFQITDYQQVENMVLNAVKLDCVVVIKVLVNHYKYIIKDNEVNLFKNAIKNGSIKVLEYLNSIGINVGSISNSVWDELYHFENEYSRVKTISQSISTILYLVKNYESFGLTKPYTDMKKPLLLVLIKSLSLEQLFDLNTAISFYNDISSLPVVDQQKSNFTNDELETKIEDLQSTNPIISEMVLQIQSFTGNRSIENSLFHEIKFNGGNGSAMNSLLNNTSVLMLSKEVFSLGDFKLLKQLNPRGPDDIKSPLYQYLSLDLFKYCPNDTDRHYQFIKDSFTYSIENPFPNHSILQLPNLFLLFVLYSNDSYVKFIIGLLDGYNIILDKYINQGIVRHIKCTEMFDVIYNHIQNKQSNLFNFELLIECEDDNILNHFKSKYPQDYQNEICKLAENNVSIPLRQFFSKDSSMFVYENFEDFEPIFKNGTIQINSFYTLPSEQIISSEVPLFAFKKIIKLKSIKKFIITSMEIIEWILETKDKSEIELISNLNYSISNDLILKYNYFKNGNLLNSNLISMIIKCGDNLTDLVNLFESIILFIVKRGDIDSLKWLIDQIIIIKQTPIILPDIQLYVIDKIIFSIISTNRLELLLFITKNYQNQFNLKSSQYINYFSIFKNQTEVSLFILN